MLFFVKFEMNGGIGRENEGKEDAGKLLGMGLVAKMLHEQIQTEHNLNQSLQAPSGSYSFSGMMLQVYVAKAAYNNL